MSEDYAIEVEIWLKNGAQFTGIATHENVQKMLDILPQSDIDYIEEK